jgi:antitoxin (DNA-binding transcriptional repressor) of toxin-antitoxin stability system
MVRMNATETVRNFSVVLSRVAAGEEIEVVRNGAPVAVIAPPPRDLVSAQTFSAPQVDSSFADDLRRLEAELEAPEDVWS